MAITGGFGMTLDLSRGSMRRWVIGRDGVQRWDDNGAVVGCDGCLGDGSYETVDGERRSCPCVTPNAGHKPLKAPPAEGEE